MSDGGEGCAGFMMGGLLVGVIIVSMYQCHDGEKRAKAEAELYNTTHYKAITPQQVESLGLDAVKKMMGKNLKPDDHGTEHTEDTD